MALTTDNAKRPGRDKKPAELPDRRADAALVRGLNNSKLLTDAAAGRALSLVRPPRDWWLWTSRMLLLVGACLTLAGVIFFFAYNWAKLTGLHKLILVQLGVAGLVIAVQWRGKEKLSGKVMVLAASVLTGVLLAAYSQVYQTGADAFELFIWWAVLIFGWVAVAEFAGLWIVWLAVLYAGIILYWVQVWRPVHQTHYSWLCILLAALSGTALFFREQGLQRGLDWLSGKWLRIVLLSAVLIALMVPGIVLIFKPKNPNNGNIIALVAWAVAMVAGYQGYRRALRDMPALAVLSLSVCIMALTAFGKFLFKNLDEAITSLFIMGVAIVAVVSLAVVWLRWTARQMAKEKHA
jgi:uncharacterized membrane protein